MDELVKFLKEQFQRHDSRLDSVDRTLAVNTELLRIHIKRTDLLEDEVKFVKKHVIFVQMLGKLLAYGVGLIGGLLAILSVLHLL